MKKDTKKRMRAILAGILALVMVLGLFAMLAPIVANGTEDEEDKRSSSEIKEELDALKADQNEIQKEIDGIESQISDNMTDMEAVVAQKSLIDQEVFLLYEQVTNINAQLNAYNALIADKQAELEVAQANYEDLQVRYKDRLRAMEKNSGVSYWSVIFKADNFLDMLDRIKLIGEIADSDKRMLQNLKDAAQEVEDAKAVLEAEKEGLEQTRSQLGVIEKELAAKRQEADELLMQLVAKGQAYEILVEDAEQRKAELGEVIDDVQDAYDEAVEREAYEAWLEEQRRIEAERKAWEALMQQQQQQGSSAGGTAGTSNTITTEEGKLLTWLVPITYTRFSSPFGYRTHPVYGDKRFHYGVDLSAPEGTPIYATRSGKVTVATYDSSAGYYVNINHGDGYVSRYLHMTHFIVSPGQSVVAGQVIGYCGSTGTSTGPHLHFGIYHNGIAVNPADYIAI